MHITNKTLWENEAEFIHLIASIKRNGIRINREFCKPKLAQGLKICNEIRSELGWNPGSTLQLGDFLLNKMNYPVLKYTEKGNASFDKFALEEYESLLEVDGSDIAQKVLRYRGWQKTTSSNYKPYLELADKNDVIHPNYKVHGTRTCRTSCELPNLQQIPRSSEKEWNGDLKKAFIPRDNHVLVEFDKAQLETRLASAVAEEEELLEAFHQDVDVFQVMADRLSWKRQDCKLFWYMTLYGAGPKKVAVIFKLDIPAAKDMINEFFGAYPNLRTMSRKADNLAKRDKYIVYWTGRRRHLNGHKGQEYHKAFNAYIQGGAFEIVKRSGNRLFREIPREWPIVLTVHDSYVVELPVADYTESNCQKIQGILEAVPEAEEMGVPFKVDYKLWGEK